MLATNRTGADTATLADAHGYGDFAGTPTVRNVGPEDNTVASDWDYGSGNPVAALVPGNAGSGLAVATGFTLA